MKQVTVSCMEVFQFQHKGWYPLSGISQYTKPGNSPSTDPPSDSGCLIVLTLTVTLEVKFSHSGLDWSWTSLHIVKQIIPDYTNKYVQHKTKCQTWEIKCMQLNNKRKKGQLEGAAEILSCLISKRTHNRLVTHSSRLTLSHISVSSKEKKNPFFDCLFPIVPRLYVLTSPQRNPLRLLSLDLST